MILCSLSVAMWLQFVQVWQLYGSRIVGSWKKKEKRSALTHSRVMIHQPMGGAQGQASDIEITAREIQKLKKELYTIIADHSHTDFDKVWADSDRDYWMTASEAKEYGMIDEVLSRKPSL